LRLELRGPQELQLARFWRREQRLQHLDLRVQAVGLQLSQQPLRIVLVIRGAHVMRSRGEPLRVIADVRRFRDAAELLLPLYFGLRVLWRIASQRRGRTAVECVTRTRTK